jgi:hypothetical protein
MSENWWYRPPIGILEKWNNEIMDQLNSIILIRRKNEYTEF